MSKRERELLHDLATPLMIIGGNIEVLLSEPHLSKLDKECIERLEKCIKSVDKISALIKSRREEIKAQDLT